MCYSSIDCGAPVGVIPRNLVTDVADTSSPFCGRRSRNRSRRQARVKQLFLPGHRPLASVGMSIIPAQAQVAEVYSQVGRNCRRGVRLGQELPLAPLTCDTGGPSGPALRLRLDRDVGRYKPGGKLDGIEVVEGTGRRVLRCEQQPPLVRAYSNLLVLILIS